MLKNQVHPAAIRSKNLIADSLLSLLKQFPYEKITIKQITDEAVLTRRTFYAHFKSKEDVINYNINSLNIELTKIIFKQENNNQHEIALIYFDFWVKHIKLLKTLYDHGLMQHLFSNFDENIKDIKMFLGCSRSQEKAIYNEYSSAFFTGVLSSILTKWLATGSKESSEELVDLLEEIAHKFSNSFR